MGCGTSKAVPVVVDEEAPENLKEAATHLISEAQQEIASLSSSSSQEKNSSSHSNPSNKYSSSPKVPHSNSNGIHPHQQNEGDQLSPSKQEIQKQEEEKKKQEEIEEEEEKRDKPRELPELPHSAGRAVAFEVGSPEEEGEDSLIRKHPPKKFQRLEDQQQGPGLTQEILEEKQAIAEKRRQEILTQRVQSAKQRTARSAGRMRTRPSDPDDVDQLEDGVIETPDRITTENEL